MFTLYLHLLLEVITQYIFPSSFRLIFSLYFMEISDFSIFSLILLKYLVLAFFTLCEPQTWTSVASPI
jgi:hypothetical protein